ncbi:MAG: tetratricopeptide repeat protein [Leptospirales bacterium]|nr:tetratricopeptide repeat protein [Leptospirales bacterium]
MRQLRKLQLLGLLVIAASCGGKKAELDKKFAEANRLFETQNTPQALKLYQEITDADSDHTGAHVMIGRILYYDRKFGEAEKVLAETVSRQPESVDAIFWLARVQSVIPAKKEEAMKNLEILLQRDGSRVDALVLKGMLHEEKKEVSQAIVAYRAATQHEQDIGQAYFRLASIYSTAGLEDMKRKALVRAALLAPELVTQKR